MDRNFANKISEDKERCKCLANKIRQNVEVTRKTRQKQRLKVCYRDAMRKRMSLGPSRNYGNESFYPERTKWCNLFATICLLGGCPVPQSMLYHFPIQYVIINSGFSRYVQDRKLSQIKSCVQCVGHSASSKGFRYVM